MAQRKSELKARKTIELTQKQLDILESIEHKTGENMSQIIRRLIEEYQKQALAAENNKQ